MIRLEELCIGDIVYAVNGHSIDEQERLSPPMRVVSLGAGAGGWVNLEIDPEQGDPFEYESSEIRGINISEELLKQYGFRAFTDEKTAWLLDTDMFHRLWMFKGSNNWTFQFINYGLGYNHTLHQCMVKHIHELQHALRSVGIEKEIELCQENKLKEISNSI